MKTAFELIREENRLLVEVNTHLRSQLNIQIDRSRRVLVCEDCGLPYRAFPIDANVDDEIWRQIMPHRGDGGILCARCIIKRAARIPGIVCAKITFEFAKLDPPKPEANHEARNSPPP